MNKILRPNPKILYLNQKKIGPKKTIKMPGTKNLPEIKDNKIPDKKILYKKKIICYDF